MIWIELAAGLILLFGGGEALVRGSVGLAMRLGVSPLLIGLTLVGFGTSTPELVASLEAALFGAPAIAIGNVVGSNIANILLILGVSAAILPIVATGPAFRRDGLVLAGATLLFLVIVLIGAMDRWLGGACLALLLFYVVFGYLSERRSPDSDVAAMHAAEAADMTPANTSLPFNAMLAVAGIGAVLLGASLLIHSAILVARSFGMSEAIIGLTLVAIGTSLPELATSIMAALKRHGDVAFGNVVGSNIFNILGIAGATALVTPITVPREIISFDIWVMLACTAFLIVFGMSGWRISRVGGALLLIAYGSYIATQLIRP